MVRGKYDEQEQLDSVEVFLEYGVEKTWDKTLTLSQAGEAPWHKPLHNILLNM